MVQLPKTEPSGSRKVDQEMMRKLLKQIADKKACFASELTHYVDGDVDEVATVLRQLVDAGILETLQPSKKHGDPRLLEASQRTGKDNIEEMRQPNWYGLNSDRNWCIKNNKDGNYYDENHNRVWFDEMDEGYAMDQAVEEMEKNGDM